MEERERWIARRAICADDFLLPRRSDRFIYIMARVEEREG